MDVGHAFPTYYTHMPSPHSRKIFQGLKSFPCLRLINISTLKYWPCADF